MNPGPYSPSFSLAGLWLAVFLFAGCGTAGADDPAADPEAETVTEAESALLEPSDGSHPGASPYPAKLRQRLAAAIAAKGEAYVPRTHHLDADGRPRFTNRLVFEDSPYLVQHAHNPVDWYPWGDEAFERARAEDKPIFLSIGYSTCHWCHVMERESFESLEIAEILNRHFIAIKLDRERRPDVDDYYMTAVQMLTGRGGWPMSSFLTPEGKPFFGGTYYPPTHFTDLLGRIRAAWTDQRQQLLDQSERLASAVAQATAARGEARAVGPEMIEKAVDQILGRHDADLGGFGRAPKFPHEPELLFLLAHSLRSGDETALAAADKSLDAMARGGIYDQVGGGFHRYSTDARWLVPHFEKMLYNQAHLARAYLAAYRLTGNRLHARTARQTFDYVLREMTDPGGGFYSATDADSGEGEGEFFVWTPDELRRVLGEEEGELAVDLWAVTEGGNFEGSNILHLPRSVEDVAAARGMGLAELLERVNRIRESLWQAREAREHPLRDDKILTDWNGMMITAFAEGADILGEERYLDAATKAAEFLWRANRRGPGELWRVHLEGSSSVPALLNDYAHLAEACVTLYDVTGEASWLERAREVANALLEKFEDAESGGFFMTAAGVDPHLLTRPKSPNDGAVPSGNSVAIRSLAMLAARTGERRYGDRANAALAAFSGSIEQYPGGFGYMLLAADEMLRGATGPRGYAASGTVRATARLEPAETGDLHLTVDLKIRDGWHLNAHETLQEHLIPTELEVGTGRGAWRLEDADYPAGEEVKLSFQDEPLRVYEGEVRLEGRVAAEGDLGSAAVLPVRIEIQACDDRVCLRPEELLLEVPAAAAL